MNPKSLLLNERNKSCNVLYSILFHLYDILEKVKAIRTKSDILLRTGIELGNYTQRDTRILLRE